MRPAIVATVVVAFLALCCKTGERERREIDSLYSRAQAQKLSGDVFLAIESFQRLVERDSLRRTTHRRELLALYEQVGDFRAALAELDRLPPADSLNARKWLYLQWLGEFDSLRQALRGKFPLSPSDELLLADLYWREEDFDRAHYHLALASRADDPLVSIKALGKLAALFEGYGSNGADSAEFFLRAISDKLARDRLERLPIEARFESLCEGGYVFAEHESFAPQADSLFALAQKLLARSDWRGANPEALSAWIDLWRNAVGAKRRETLEQSLALFQRREHRLGEAFATLLLGECDDYAPSRRIENLKTALERFEALAYIDLPYRLKQEAEKAFGEMATLLLEQERLLEAFEISERVKILRQKFSPAVVSSRAVSPAFRDLMALRNEIAALAVAKDSLAFLSNENKRIERAQLLAETMAQKQGEFYQKWLELQAQNPSEAERLSPSPATLAETERALTDGEALIQFAFGEPRSFALVIENGAIRVVRLAISRAQLRQAMKTLRFELLNGLEFDSIDVMRNPTRRALSESVYEPLRSLVAEKSRLYVLSNEPFAAHVLGGDKTLAETHLISVLASARALRLAHVVAACDSLRWISSNELDDLPLRWADFRGEALIEWGRANETIKATCATWRAPLVEAYRRYALAQANQNRYGWINFSCYGK